MSLSIATLTLNVGDAVKSINRLSVKMDIFGKRTRIVSRDLREFESRLNSAVSAARPVRDEIQTLSQVQARAAAQAEQLYRAVYRLGSSFRQTGQAVFAFSAVLSVLAVPNIRQGLEDLIRLSTEYQDNLIRTAKTAGLAVDMNQNLAGSNVTAAKSLSALDVGLRNLAKTIALPITQLSEIAVVAGQAGADTVDEIMALTEISAMFAQTVDMSGEQAVNALTRIAAAFGGLDKQGSEGLIKLANVINKLENMTTANADQIITAMLDAAGSVAYLGGSQKDLAAFSAFLINMGVSADETGTAIRRAFDQLAENSKDIAAVLGMTDEEILNQMNSGKAIDIILALADAMKQAGGDAQAYQALLDIFDLRAVKSVSRATKMIDEFATTLRIARDEWDNGNSMAEEYALSLESVKNQWQLLKNDVNELGLTLVHNFGPAISNGIALLRVLTQELTGIVAGLPEKTKFMIVAGAALFTVLAPLLTIIGSLVFAVGLFFNGIINLGAALFILTSNVNLTAIAALGLLYALNNHLPGALQLVSSGLIALSNQFKNMAGQAVAWGTNIIAAFASGMARAINRYVIPVVLQIVGAISNFIRGFSPAKKGPLANVTKWGRNIISAYLDGFKDVAKGNRMKSLKDAIGSISGLMEGHSPAKEGPLKYIMQWGSNLMAAYLEGFNEIDFDLLKSVTGKIESMLASMLSAELLDKPEMLTKLADFRIKLAEAISSFNLTGQLPSELFSDLTAEFGEAGQELSKLVEYQLRYNKAQKELNDLQTKRNGLSSQFRLEARAIETNTSLTASQKATALANLRARRGAEMDGIDRQVDAKSVEMDRYKKLIDWQDKYIDAMQQQDDVMVNLLESIKELSSAISSIPSGREIENPLEKLTEDLGILHKLQEKYVEAGMDVKPLLRDEINLRERIAEELERQGLDSSEQIAKIAELKSKLAKDEIGDIQKQLDANKELQDQYKAQGMDTLPLLRDELRLRENLAEVMNSQGIDNAGELGKIGSLQKTIDEIEEARRETGKLDRGLRDTVGSLKELAGEDITSALGSGSISDMVDELGGLPEQFQISIPLMSTFTDKMNDMKKVVEIFKIALKGGNFGLAAILPNNSFTPSIYGFNQIEKAAYRAGTWIRRVYLEFLNLKTQVTTSFKVMNAYATIFNKKLSATFNTKNVGNFSHIMSNISNAWRSFNLDPEGIMKLVAGLALLYGSLTSFPVISGLFQGFLVFLAAQFPILAGSISGLVTSLFVLRTQFYILGRTLKDLSGFNFFLFENFKLGPSSAIKRPINVLFENLTVMATALTTRFFNVISSLVKRLGGLLLSAFNTFIKPFPFKALFNPATAIPALKAYFAGIKAVFLSQLLRLQAFAVNLWFNFINFLGVNLAGFIQKWASLISSKLMVYLGFVFNPATIIPAIKALIVNMGGALMAFLPVLKTFGISLVSGLLKFGLLIGQGAAVIGAGLAGGLLVVVGVISVIAGAFMFLKEHALIAWGAIKTFADNFLRALGFVNSTVLVMQNGMPTVVKKFGPMFGPLHKAFQRIKEGLGPIIGLFMALGRVLASTFVGMLPGLGTALGGFASAIIAAFSFVIGTIGGVITIITSLFKAITTGDWGQFKDTVFKVFENLLADIEMFVGGIVTTVLGIFQALAGGVFGAIMEIMSLINPASSQAHFDVLFVAGQDIIQGFIDGILLKGAEIWEWVKGVFQGFVDAVLGFFGIASPSTLFIGIGQDIINGLIEGVKSLVDTAVDFILGIFTRVAEAGIPLISPVFRWLLDVGIPWIKQTADFLWAAVSTAIGWLLVKAAELKDSFFNAFANIRAFIDETWLKFSLFFADLLIIVSGAISRFDELKEMVLDLWRKGAEVIEKSLQGFLAWIKGDTELAKKMFDEARQALKDVWYLGGNLIQAYMENFLNFIKNTLGEILKIDVVKYIKDIWDRGISPIKGNVEAFFGGLENILENIYDWLRDIVGLWQRVAGIIGEAQGEMGGQEVTFKEVNSNDKVRSKPVYPRETPFNADTVFTGTRDFFNQDETNTQRNGVEVTINLNNASIRSDNDIRKLARDLRREIVLGLG